MEIKHWRWE